MFNPAQYLQAQSLVEAHTRSFHAYAQAMLRGSADLVEFQLDSVKAAMASATVASNQLLSTKDPQEWISLTAAQSQQALDRAQAYGRQAAGIAQGAHALWTEAALPLQGLFNGALGKSIE